MARQLGMHLAAFTQLSRVERSQIARHERSTLELTSTRATLGWAGAGEDEATAAPEAGAEGPAGAGSLEASARTHAGRRTSAEAAIRGHLRTRGRAVSVVLS